MEILWIVAGMAALIVVLGVILAMRVYQRGRLERANDILHRKQQLAGVDVHAWFDHDFKNEWGASLYEMEDGSEKEVTMISDNQRQMCHRKYGSKTVYLGKVKKFVRRAGFSPHNLIDHFPPDVFGDYMDDVAMLAFLSVVFWDEYYPEDMSFEDPPEDFDDGMFAEAITDEPAIVPTNIVVEDQLPSIETEPVREEMSVSARVEEAESPSGEDEPSFIGGVRESNESVETSSHEGTKQSYTPAESYDSGSSDSGGGGGGSGSGSGSDDNQSLSILKDK